MFFFFFFLSFSFLLNFRQKLIKSNIKKISVSVESVDGYVPTLSVYLDGQTFFLGLRTKFRNIAFKIKYRTHEE
jgi:hypothetical protein